MTQIPTLEDLDKSKWIEIIKVYKRRYPELYQQYLNDNHFGSEPIYSNLHSDELSWIVRYIQSYFENHGANVQIGFTPI